MAKNKKSRAKHMPKSVERSTPAITYPPLMLGEFEVPKLTGIAATFGARLREYPPRAIIKKVPQKYSDIVDDLFFCGGTLAKHGLRLKSGIDHGAAMSALRAWLCSFEPSHEHKIETVAWALSEWCEKA
jgi:hypothetical protein